MKPVYALLGILFSVSGGYADSWNHISQNQWPKTCLEGKRQSPIDLNPKEAVEQSSFKKFTFHNYGKQSNVFVKNTGHSVELRTKDTSTIEGGGLSKPYTLDHVHFHWQSEHTLNGRRYPLEVHIVHYASEYKNLTNALNYGDGVAVLGVFYSLSPDDDYEFEPLTRVLHQVEGNYNAIPMQEEVELRSFLPRDVAGFYRYDGSLTTPGCNEAVIWTVFTNTIPISKSQVKQFEDIQSDGGKLKVNYRDVQKLGQRKLYRKISPVEPNHSSRLRYEHILTAVTLFLSLRILF